MNALREWLIRKNWIDGDPYKLRTMSIEELCEWIGQWQESSPKYLLGMTELKRRQEQTKRVFGGLALVVAVLGLVAQAYLMYVQWRYPDRWRDPSCATTLSEPGR